MKSKLILISSVFTMLSLPAYYAGAEGEAPVPAEGQIEVQEASVPPTAVAGSEEQAAAVEVNNKFCPVSKEDVYSMGEPVKYEHNGKIYNFCCKMCLKDFKADPEKFGKIAEESEKVAPEVEAPVVEQK